MSFILLGILNSQAAGAVGEGSYDLLETTVLDADTASVEFTGLGAYTDYKHLQVRAVAKTNRTRGEGIVSMYFNSDTTSSYASHELTGNGSSVLAIAYTTESNIRIAGRLEATDLAPASAYGAGVVDILDFSSTTKNTTIKSLSGHTGDDPEVDLSSGLYFKTDAITSMTFTPFNATNLLTGSRFSLYGIKTGA